MGTICDKIRYLVDTKNRLKDALVARGVDVSDETPFREYVDLIESVSGNTNLNIAFGETAPDDTNKLWIKTDQVDDVRILPSPAGTPLHDGYRQLQVAAENMQLCTIGTNIYVFNGYQYENADESPPTKTVQVFDTVTQMVYMVDTELPDGVCEAGIASVGSKIYLFGGRDTRILNSTSYDAIYVFDTELNQLSLLDTVLPVANSGMGCASVGSKIYLFAGAKTSGIYVFDTNTETITTLATSMSANFNGLLTAAIGSKIYITGGSNYATLSKNSAIWEFNSETGILTTLVPNPTSGGSEIYWATAVGDKVYYGTNLIYCFDPADSSRTYLKRNFTYYKDYDTYLNAIAVGATIFAFGGRNGFANSKYVYKDVIEAFETDEGTLNAPELLTTNQLRICSNTTGNQFILLQSDNMSVQVCVDSVYVGREDGIAEKVEAFLYKDGAWTSITVD